MKAATTMPTKIMGPKNTHPPPAKPPVKKKAKKSPKKDNMRAVAPWTPSQANHNIPPDADIAIPANRAVPRNKTTIDPIVSAQVVFQGTTTHSCHGIQKHQHNAPLSRSAATAGMMQKV